MIKGAASPHPFAIPLTYNTTLVKRNIYAILKIKLIQKINTMKELIFAIIVIALIYVVFFKKTTGKNLFEETEEGHLEDFIKFVVIAKSKELGFAIVEGIYRSKWQPGVSFEGRKKIPLKELEKYENERAMI